MKLTIIQIISIFLYTSIMAQNNIKYITNSSDINKKALELIEVSIKNNVIPKVDKTVICGPNLWQSFNNTFPNKIVEGIDINFHVNKQIIEGRALQNHQDQAIMWEFVSQKNKEYIIRKPTQQELEKYWQIIPFVIEEPIYVIDFNNVKYIVDIDPQNLTLFFIEKL